MSSKLRFKRWLIAIVLAATCLLAWRIATTRSNEPVYQGRPLGKWLRGHPREYYPAVLAVGTNALPYLLAELQATDSRVSQWGQGVLVKMSMGPFWRTAQDRRYHAGIGLQILDTNAVPALMEMIFSRPMQIAESNPSWSGAAALMFMGSGAAQNQVADRIADALRSADAEQRRNGCLTLSVYPHPREDLQVLLPTLCSDSNAMVRAAAMRAMLFTVWTNQQALPALISGLEDDQASVRRLAIAALENRGSNAISALPVLRVAYLKEVTQSDLRGDLGDGTWGTHSWSAQEIRVAIRDAIKVIDPSALPPVDSP